MQEVITLERILLQTIKFDLQVEHPYSFLLRYAKCFKGDQQKLQKMVQMAWNFVNDSLSTVVCLQWEPEIIAVALIYLASKLSKFTVVDWVGRQPQHTRWWDMFVSDVTMDILEDICHQVLDLYQTNSKESPESNSPPQKPPSRADSPTPMKPLPIANNSGSPAGKTKTPLSAITTSSSSGCSSEPNNIQSIKTISSSGPATATTVPGPTPIEHAQSSTQGGGGVSTSYHQAPHHHSSHHMYSAPQAMSNHPMHAMYQSVAPPPPPGGGYVHPPATTVSGSSSGSGVVPPPLPPPPLMPYGSLPPYGGPYANPVPSIAPLGGGPPPPPPGVDSNLLQTGRSGGGGYYQPPPPGSYSSGGRQRY